MLLDAVEQHEVELDDVVDLHCTDSKARTILGSAFGVKSIAHVLACLAGIGEA